MDRVSREDRAYFERIARQNASLPEDLPPASLAEMFDRLERIRRIHGSLAHPGAADADDGDLASHLALLRRGKQIARGDANRT